MKPTLGEKSCNLYCHLDHCELGFPTGRDSATFRDKGTAGQAQTLATGRDGPGQPVKIQDGMRDGTITIFLSKSGTGHGM